ncbi:uridylate kinase [Bradyrhizobium diazoefficiens]|uniref:amino acid kinase family protein n=1 Tax=Bradyrhizobium diazoefficiens TaxID=1355477 RepID=UPI00190D474B|nr:uridylate kinase [Bradyrhizobium diazoefficiens]QQO13854.1 uridylate kinase [Bradyrhizobium diazoefficiens]
MTVKIMKFGGSSFREAHHYRSVSAHIMDRLVTDADQIVVVVSAMYGATDSLKELALSVNERCEGAALGTVLTTGEIVSVGLLEAALKRYSVPVSSLFGYSLGIQTSSGATRSCIENIDKSPLRAALQASRIVIVAGAQGVDKGGRLSMLGRNSSDLTAVVAADIVGSSSCEIYSDVCGIYTSDPYLVNGARLVPKISYASVNRMARRGARVVHSGAVEYASTRGIVISCKSLVPREIVGTVVGSIGDAATVVIDRSAKKVKFKSLFVLQVALALLDTLDITWVEVDQDKGYDIYLSHDVDFALNELVREGIKPLYVSNIVLVTEISSGRQRTYEFEDLESAVSCARTVHATLYPAEEAARPSH